jgi:hypothetical protein
VGKDNKMKKKTKRKEDKKGEYLIRLLKVNEMKQLVLFLKYSEYYLI